MDQQTAFVFTAARARRDVGMSRSVNHAGAVWAATAFAFVVRYALTHSEPFMTEDVIRAAASEGLPEPPDRRAFGAIMKKAQREGHIVADGYAPAATSNCSPKVRWRRA